jgi:hypothetical protein
MSYDKEEFNKRYFGKHYLPGLRDIVPLDRQQEIEIEENSKRIVEEDNKVKAIQNLKPISCPLEIPSDIPPDSWLAHWSNFSKEVSRKRVFDRSNHWLDVWAGMKDGSRVWSSDNLNSWRELRSRLLYKECMLGLIAVRQASPTIEGKPGFTIIVADPNAKYLSETIITTFKQHRLAVALKGYEPRERWAEMKYIFSPHWYAKSGDEILGHNWPKLPKSALNTNAAKTIWCKGAENAIRQVLKKVPENCIESFYLDSYATNDEVDLLSKDQRRTLRITKPDKLEAMLLKPEIPPTGFWAGLLK